MTLPILVICAAWFAQQQQPPPRPPVANVEGRVLNTLTARGVPGAAVILRSRDTAEGTSYEEETDANGNFRISDVAPGEYTITADRDSFFQQPNGAPGAPMPRIKVATGQQLADVVIKMTPTGVIAGRILDQDGEPIRGAVVQAMQYANVGGKPQLRNVEQVQSKDKGEYRLFGLRPGSYRLQVQGQVMRAGWTDGPEVRGQRVALGYASTFFPSTPDATRAVPVELHAGAELRGFDITVGIAEPGHSVRFNFTKGDNVGILPRLWPLDGFRNNYGQNMHSTGETVEFVGVPPGSYLLLVTRQDGNSRTYARQRIEVSDADVDAGTLSFAPAAEVKGVVRMEGKSSSPLRDLNVSLQPESRFQQGSGSGVKVDGSFELKEVIPDVYQVVVRAPDGFYLKSIRAGDEELPDRRLDATRGEPGALTIVLATDIGQIEGSVIGADGNPAVGARVTMFPDGAQAGRSDLFKFVFTDGQGKFRLDKVPPGEYRLFAWQDVQPGGPQDPELRKRFEKQSVRVKLAPNGQETVPLTAIVTKTGDPQ
jgi:Carboxypeptidase regulatory-like domain